MWHLNWKMRQTQLRREKVVRMHLMKTTNPDVEFEDQSYKLAQTYQLEDEYQDMTAEQEAAEVQTLLPWEQAEYWEMTKLHQ